MPYKDGQTLGPILPRERVLDHYNSHVLRCPDCQKGLRDLRSRQKAALITSEHRVQDHATDLFRNFLQVAAFVEGKIYRLLKCFTVCNLITFATVAVVYTGVVPARWRLAVRMSGRQFLKGYGKTKSGSKSSACHATKRSLSRHQEIFPNSCCFPNSC